MPFVNPLHKKRQRSLSRGPHSPTGVCKHPRLAEVLYDGSGSRKSAESSSTGFSAKSSVVTQRVRRGVASMVSFFGAVSKSQKDVTLESDESSIVISHNGRLTGSTHADDSNATTIVENASQMALLSASRENEQRTEDAATVPGVPTRHTAPSSAMTSRKPSRLDLHRSTSTPAVYMKLHHKIMNTFNNDPTVVVKPSLRSRPSVQTLQNETPDWAQSQLSSSPSTYTSGSGSSPKAADKSTPVTSDGLPSTPTSVRHYEGIAIVDADQSLVLHHDTIVSRLSTIPEITNSPSVSIKTVEATAAAKIFFETHFNAILNDAVPRQLRRERLETELHRRGASSAVRRSRVLSTPSSTTSGPSSIAIGGFEVVKVLGKGSFGVVRLVRERSISDRKGSLGLANLPFRFNLKGVATPHRTRRGVHKLKKDVYAMKVIRKSEMLGNGQEGHLRAERDFLAAAEGSKWVVPLLAAFQDNKFLYLVMDFCIGGDFLGLLIRYTVLNEDVTRWYIAEMILCIEEAHRMKWIHRDVKPDNFLITSDGHLKISDFGLAFDGDWDHDQKFYHSHRYDLVDHLSLEVRGDDDDVAEETEIANSQKVAEMFPPLGCQPQKKHARPSEALSDVPVLDYRNRAERRRLARSVVGTSQYMAPEVIRGDMYDGRCD